MSNRTLSRSLLAVALFGATFAAGSLSAQQTPQVVESAWNFPWPGTNARWMRQPAVEQALREHGYRPDRLSRNDERALARGFSELYPEQNPDRYRLNRTQANALVYVSLVAPGGGRGGGTPRFPACDAAERRVHDLDGLYAAPGRGQPRFLHRNEQQRLHEAAQQIQRLARQCGDHATADESGILISILSNRQSDREQVHRQVYRMQSLTRWGSR